MVFPGDVNILLNDNLVLTNSQNQLFSSHLRKKDTLPDDEGEFHLLV